VKLFEETGPALKAIHVLTENPGQKKFLFVERDGGDGVTDQKGYVVLQGKIPQLFEIKTPPLYLKAATVSDQLEVWVSGSHIPTDQKSAEKVFIWDDSKEQFLSKSGEVLSDKVLVPTPTLTFTCTFTPTSTNTPIPTATPVPIVKKSKPTPVPEEKPAVEKVVESARVTPPSEDTTKPQPPAEVPEAVEPASQAIPSGPVPTALKWWREPINPAAAYQQLKTSLVPTRVKANNLSLLGQQAKNFFEALRAKGVSHQIFSDYRAGYYTAVARALNENGRAQEAKNYVGMVLKGRPDFKEALQLQAEMK
jgi:hypothetical protein